MASNPLAVIKRALSERLIAVPAVSAPVGRGLHVTAMNGTRQTPSHPLRASDYLTPRASFPLVYVTDINGWSQDRTTSAVSFSLTHGAQYTNEAASFQCRLPFADGDLFDKRGAYLVIVMPAEDQETVGRILGASRKGR